MKRTLAAFLAAASLALVWAPGGSLAALEGRAMRLDRGSGGNSSVPPRGYRSPHAGLAFAPSDSASFIERRAVAFAVEEVRRLRQFLAEQGVDEAGWARRSTIGSTVEKSLASWQTRLGEKDRDRLLEWVLIREGVREGEASSREALLGRIEPDPPDVALTAFDRLDRLAKAGCSLVIRYPDAFDAVVESRDTDLRPDYAHLDLHERTAEEAVFRARFDFRQEVPGPNTIQNPDFDPSEDNAYQRYKDPKATIPPHPVLEGLDKHTGERFVLLTPNHAHAGARLSVSEPVYAQLGLTWYRYLQAAIPRAEHAGGEVALGYVGDDGPAPAVIRAEAAAIGRDHCLIRQLARRIEERRGGEAWFRVAYALGRTGTTLRLAVEYRLLGGEGPRRWTGFADLTAGALTVRYAAPMTGDDAEMSRFLTERGVTVLADRDRDGLGDLVYSAGTGHFSGTVIRFGERVRIQRPQMGTD